MFPASARHEPLAPLLRWPGSKRKLLPFAGSAALFFWLRPQRAVLADACSPLMSFYRYASTMPRVLRRDLDCLLAEHNADVTGAYERIRARFNMFGRNAAEFAYLNATCFNGLYREDYDGRFNSPRGSRANERLRAPLLPHLEDCSVALRKASLRICDFGATCLQQADRGDLWYFDPPYDSIDGAGFTGYTSRCWNRAQASRLQREVSDLARRKRNRPRVMVSGPDTPFIRDQYSFLHCHELDASHAIGGKKARRRAIKELVFTNYEV